MGIKDELTETEFKNREYLINHIPYDSEMAFFQSIKNGDMEEMHRLFKPLCVEGFGKLSDNPLRNLKYHLIITVAMITRYVIEAGLEMEAAYNLSDIYIRKIDTCNSVESINEIHKELCESYVKRMQGVKNSGFIPAPSLNVLIIFMTICTIKSLWMIWQMFPGSALLMSQSSSTTRSESRLPSTSRTRKSRLRKICLFSVTIQLRTLQITFSSALKATSSMCSGKTAV